MPVSSNAVLQRNGLDIRNGLVPKMCTSGGRQCKTVPILGFRVLVHPNQTWMFLLTTSQYMSINTQNMR